MSIETRKTDARVRMILLPDPATETVDAGLQARPMTRGRPADMIKENV